ncbi:MAG: PD-(D/E)XK nuclease family protein [Paludibacteraceae bacterium]|nr:PD-(D/E)XK nuclease family protein [Paludibacteraceae bacterium]
MDSFLKQTAQSIIASFDWRELHRITLVLPSHRAGIVLKDELLRLQQAQHTQAVWAPQVLTLTQLQDSLSPLYPEDELMTIVRLYKKLQITNHKSQMVANGDLMSLDLFYNWGRQILADFTNIDASMPAEDVPLFFDNTLAAHELEQWQLDEETEARLRALMATNQNAVSPESVRHHYELLWRQLYDLYKALHEEMASAHKGYAGMRQRAVIEQWESDELQAKIKGRTYIFVGFNYLLPVELELMKRLRDTGQARFYWDLVPDFQTNTKAFYFAQKNAAILGIQNQEVLPSTPINAKNQEPKAVTVLSCVSKESQAQYVHRWLQENYYSKGEKVGIVICDETMLEPVIYALPAITLQGEEQPEPINITKGFPLRNTQIYADTLRWLNQPARGQADDIVSPALIDELLAALFSETPNTPEHPKSQETPALSLSWQELLLLESAYQVRKIANQMRLLITQGLGDVPFTLRLVRLLMRRTMESVTMPFHGEPVTDIQVMGVLETRLLDFDRLLLLNVEEGVVPQRQQDSSFIPYYLRKTYHMQTPDERATVYAYNFFRLLNRAGHATLLFASAETAEGGKGMSRFIMQMLVSPDFIVTKGQLQEQSVVVNTSLFDEEKEQPSLLSLLHPNALGMLLRETGQPYRLSPSALNTFISCPRSFYLQYILGLRPQEKEDTLFEPNTMGSFIHHAMEHIYTHFIPHSSPQPALLSPDTIEAIRVDELRLQQALTAAYEAMNALWLKDHPTEPDHYIQAHHVGENIVIVEAVNHILERDREDAKKGLRIYRLESEYTFPITIDGVGTILSGGIIDRLDIFGAQGHETLRVVDYKSGGYNDQTHAKKMSSNWEELMVSEEKNYVRQTLIYSQAVLKDKEAQRPVEPNLYFCRHALTEMDTTIAIEGEAVHDYRPLQEKFLEQLTASAKQVLTATQFPQCEPDKCPSYCPFFQLCGRTPNTF